VWSGWRIPSVISAGTWEDAIVLNLVTRDELPAAVSDRLGRTNGAIVYSLVSDLITHSYNKNYVGYSPGVGEALKTLREFNYRRIYDNPRIKQETGKIEELFADLFQRFFRDITENRRHSPIWREYLATMDEEYFKPAPPATIVRDYLASMTDATFLRQCQELFFPQPLPLKFA
jgi:dGTPase